VRKKKKLWRKEGKLTRGGVLKVLVERLEVIEGFDR